MGAWTARAEPLPASLLADPLQVAARWPLDRPLLLLRSGRPHPRWARWTILACPSRWILIDEGDPHPLETLRGSLGTADRLPRAPAPPAAPCAGARPAAAPLEVTRSEPAGPRSAPPFPAGGWIGYLGYELGRCLEPAVRATDPTAGMPGAPPRSARRPEGRVWPVAALGRCDAALVHDEVERRWWIVPPPAAAARGDGALDLRAILEEAALSPGGLGAEWRLDPFHDVEPRGAWLDAVNRVVGLIRAGDIFQANLVRHLASELHGGPAAVRALALAALRTARPWHGAFLELPDRSALISLSPELFLSGRLAGEEDRPGSPAPLLLTRPIKGTLAAHDDAAALLASAKDAAELNMIVDLMRNDLGRVCRPGSVRVSEPRHIETHPTVHQAVATVEGEPRPGVDPADLLAATFPPGSVTGAPKIRAMQVIESLEPHARGPYCGAIGFVGDDGSLGFNVAIRTLAVAPPRDDGSASVVYGVGCGIVADSDPAKEWNESEAKAAILRDIVGSRHGRERRREPAEWPTR